MSGQRNADCPSGWPDLELIRKARAVELVQSNVPLPVVQSLLGLSTPNSASSFVTFSAGRDTTGHADFCGKRVIKENKRP